MYTVQLDGPTSVFAIVSPEYGTEPMPFMDVNWSRTSLAARSEQLTNQNFAIWRRDAEAGQLVLGADDDRTKRGITYAFVPVLDSSAFQQIATTQADVTEYVDMTALSGTEYVYRVRAVNTLGISSFSKIAIATTGGTPPVNMAPSVDAGDDQATALPENAVILNAVAQDDGLPKSQVTTQWSVSVGDSQQVSVTDDSSVNTAVNFAGVVAPATYDWILPVSAGSATVESQLRIDVVQSDVGEDLALEFHVGPARVMPDQAMIPAVEVVLMDSNGQMRTDLPTTVTLSLGGPNPNGIQLSGTTTVATVNGMAVFDDLNFDRVGDSIELVASSPDVTTTKASRRFFITDPGSGNGTGIDYDIVYVRAPRYGDDQITKMPEIKDPINVEPGTDLMLLHPDGTEEVLVPGVTVPFWTQSSLSMPNGCGM